MKKHLRTFAFVAMVAGAFACTKGPDEVPVGGELEMSVEATFQSATKAAMDSETGAVEWELGDQISLLNGNSNFALTSTSAGPVAEFKGTAVQLSVSEQYLAVYPYDESYKLEGRSFNVNLPKVVKLIPDSFSQTIGTGYVTEGKVHFNHATAYLGFEITRDDITSIVISAEGKALSGAFKAIVNNSGVASLTAVAGQTSDELLVNTEALAGKYFVPIPADKYNGFNITVKTTDGVGETFVESFLNLSTGKIVDLGAIDTQIEIKKSQAPTVAVLSSTSSTVSVSWSVSNFASPATDLLSEWSVGIYNDAACSNLIVSWDIPSSLFTSPEGNIYSLEGPYSPRFIFSGLEANTDYYVKAWHTAMPESASEAVAAKTLASSNVTLATNTAKTGDVILSEDFSELVWGGDVAGRFWGYSDNKRGSATGLNSAVGANPVGKHTINGFEHDFYLVAPNIEIGLFNTLANAVKNSRLAGWASISEDNSDGRACGRPGYVKLGGGSKAGGIVTPQLSTIEGKAVVKVTFKAHPYKEPSSDNTKIRAMVITADEASISNGTIKSYTTGDSKEFVIPADSEWKEYSCELLVSGTDRIALYSVRNGTASSAQCRTNIDDIKIEVLETFSASKVYSIANATDLQSFMMWADEYAADEVVELANNIDLKDYKLTTATSFKGTLDGKGYSIENWNNKGQWLVKELYGTIKNLKIGSSCTVTPAINTDFGIFASLLKPHGKILDCENNADITLETASHDGSRFSAFVGKNDGLIKNCVNNGDITINAQKRSGNVYIGAFTGNANPKNQLAEGESVTFENLLGFDNCTNNGDITYYCNSTGGYVFVGGIGNSTTVNLTTDAGNVDPSTVQRCNFKDCTNNGNITVTITNGGSMADNAGTGGSGNYSNIGGCVGFAMGELVNCDNTGSITFNVPTNETTAGMSRPAVGGVAGYVWKSMTDCDNSGAVTVKGTFANGGTNNAGAGNHGAASFGGVVGQIGPMVADDAFAMTNCHNSGAVKFQSWMAATNGSASYLGGVAGYSTVQMTNCSNNGKALLESKSAYVNAGGVVGYCTQAMDQLTNDAETEINLIRTTAASKQIGSQTYVAGVAGYSKVSLTNSTNEKAVKITVTTEDTSSQLQAGGVVGRAEGAFDNCTNNGDVTFNHGGVNGATAGGVAGWIVSSSVSGGSNNGTVTYTSDDVKTASSWVGGYAGHMGTVTSVKNIKNTKPLKVSFDAKEIPYIGGICGRWSAGTVENVVNGPDAAITVSKVANDIPAKDANGKDKNRHIYIGGIVGCNNAAASYSGCKNEATITVSNDVQIKNQLFVSGIAGISENTSTYTDCSNSGALTLNMPNGTSHGGNSCFSGIATGTSASVKYISCKNTGDMTLDCPANQWRIGGIAGYNGGSGVITDCTVESDILIKSAATSIQNIGGLLGYGNIAKFSGNTVKGSVKAEQGKAKVGGFVGSSNGGHTFENCVIDADVAAPSTDGWAGMFVGSAYSTANLTYNIGSTSAPSYIIKGSTLNGNEIQNGVWGDNNAYLVGTAVTRTVNATAVSVVETVPSK